MSELIPPVTIGLLERHGHLPDPSTVLERFGSHYAESANRQRQNEALALEPEAAGELEDFSALAATALDSAPEADGDLFGGSDDADWLSEEELEGLLSDDLEHPSETEPEAAAAPDGEAAAIEAEAGPGEAAEEIEAEAAPEEAVEEAAAEDMAQVSEENPEAAAEEEAAETQAEAASESSDEPASTDTEAEKMSAETAESPADDAPPEKKKAASKGKRKRKSKKKKKG